LKRIDHCRSRRRAERKKYEEGWEERNVGAAVVLDIREMAYGCRAGFRYHQSS
jgi:hypothetical protein